ncbi:trypsin-like peptidase domain-containing protein [Streptomyces bungoensis]
MGGRSGDAARTGVFGRTRSVFGDLTSMHAARRPAAPADPPPPAGDPTRTEALVQIRDLAGRPRGVGFLADHHGTLLTSHEAVDGLARLVLHAAGDRTCVVEADAVTPLPSHDLALVRTEGLGLPPLPLTVRDRVEAGAYVRIAAGCWREARVLAATQVTYTATDRFHLVEDALELAIGTAGQDALRLGGGAAGGPVLDARTGAVLGVLGTALHTARRDAGFAVPLRPADGPLADLLARNAATVPAYGADLNLAGVLELTAASVDRYGPPGALTGRAGTVGGRPVEPVERVGVVAESTAFTEGHRSVLGLVGAPGTVGGRPVEPVERAGVVAESTAFTEGHRSVLGLVGAPGNVGGRLVEPVERVGVVAESTAFTEGHRSVLGLVGAPGSGRTTELAALAARRHRAERPAPTLWLRGADLRDADAGVADAVRRALRHAARSLHPADLGDLTPERVAGLARRAGRPLLILLDGPEEMPPDLAHRLPEWTAVTARWLRETGARLVVACREEYWEQAGVMFPADLLHTPADSAGALPPCVRLDGLTAEEAHRARAAYGIPDHVLTGHDARHPLTLRLLAEVRAALPDDALTGPVDRHEVLAAHLDLMCLRVAVRLARENGLRGTAVRRLAARVAGQVHEAARRSLGPGEGELDRESFEAVFPPGAAPARLGGGSGWASAVLTEGLLVPAGSGYRFAHGELADWIQGMHLDLDEALNALVHRPVTAPEADPLPVPHHRAGPVVQSLLLLARQQGTQQLGCHLRELVDALDQAPTSWWAARLVTATLLQVPDATPYTEVLRLLADRIVTWRRAGHPVPAALGPAFWLALPVPEADRFALLRELVLADGPPAEPAAAGDGEGAGRSGRDVGLAAGGSGERAGGAEAVVGGARGPVDGVHGGVGAPCGPVDDAGLAVGGARDSVDGVHVALVAPRGPVDGACLAVVAPCGPVDDASSAVGGGRGPDDAVHVTVGAPRGPVDDGGLAREALGGPTGDVGLAAGTRDDQGAAVSPAQGGPADRTGDLLARPGEPAGTGTGVGAGAGAVRTAPVRPAETAPGAGRYLDAVARLLAAAPGAVQPHLVRWFDDERPLPATPDATVATAAQALLHTHRHGALDDLTEALVRSAHPRADELLAVLAEDEPPAVCRAVDRWAHDERPARRVAAVTSGLRAAPHVRSAADRELLRYAALTLLARPADRPLHGGALALLVRDPHTRDRYLIEALHHFRTGDLRFPSDALVPALATHPDPVLDAFRARLLAGGPDAGEALRTLAGITGPALACRIAALVREAVGLRPDIAGHVAAYADRRLDQGPAARSVLQPLVTGLLDGGPDEVRAALAAILAAPGAPASRPLRRELLDFLLTHEQDPAVLDTVLRTAVGQEADEAPGEDREAGLRELVHRTGILLVRTPEGATRFDWGLVDLARHVPRFAARVTRWLTEEPERWAAVVGPSARRMIENLAGPRVPA